MRSFREAAVQRPPTTNEQQAINDVYELLSRWQTDDISWDELKAATTGKQRFLATTYTNPDHPLHTPLMSMLDALVSDNDNIVRTDQGVNFDRSDFGAVDGRIVRRDGMEYLQFPVVHKPGDSPIYRGDNGFTELDRAIWARQQIEPYEKEWWEGTDEPEPDE